jgi:PKD repeat protein
MRLYLVFFVAIMILAYPSVCNEIAYTIGPNGEKPIGQGNITEYKGSDVVSFTTSASPRGPSTSYQTQRTVDSIKDEINTKINTGNQPVRDEGLDLVGSASGAQRIDQICSIYDYLVNNWTFVSDWKGLDEFQYSNYTLKKGLDVGKSGKGDCDDFSILLSALIESIGGTPRIILAYSPAGGHAYTEVYLGNNNTDVDMMQKWLQKKYNVTDVYIHADPENGDVWLNMDWWTDSGGAIHPGGPFYQATSQVPISIQEDLARTPLTPVENQPPRSLFSFNPDKPEVENIVCFDASGSTDPDGKIVDYEWDFGDGNIVPGTTKSNCKHVYLSAGKFPVKLTITDDYGDKSSKTLEIDVKEPLPEAIGTYSPTKPEVNEVITFDASQSKTRRGQIAGYQWDFDDGNMGNRAIMKHQYLDSGLYNVKLTVTNDKGLNNSTSINVNVGQESELTNDKRIKNASIDTGVQLKEPVKESLTTAVFSFSPAEPKVDEVVTFDASGSKDDGGQITEYQWDFDDGNMGNRAIMKHLYTDSGTYNVKLTVTNDKGFKNTTTKTLSISEAQAEKASNPSGSSESAEPIGPSVIHMPGSSAEPIGPSVIHMPGSSAEPIESSGNYDTITIRSTQYKGYDVQVDGVYVGSDGKGQDVLDGIYTFKVTGNQQHQIRVDHPYNWKMWQYPYNAGESYNYDF